MMECAPEDIVHARGGFEVRGTDRRVSFAAVADVAYHGAKLGGDLTPGLEPISPSSE